MSRKWDELYRGYLNDETLSEFEIGKLMDKYRPKKLYKFMCFDEYWEKNIFDGQAYLSEASNLNDPFDCLIYINDEMFTEYMAKYACKIFNLANKKLIQETTRTSIIDNLDKYLFNMKSKFRVACFTENNTSGLMWAHYADSYKGFCVEYDLMKLPEGYRYSILPVIYSDKRYDATKAVISQNKNLAINPYYFKSFQWEYEKEWRIVIPENIVTDGEYYADFSKGITGIYLGLKSFDFHKEKCNQIIEIYSQKCIPVYKTKIEQSSYSLEFIPIS